MVHLLGEKQFNILKNIFLQYIFSLPVHVPQKLSMDISSKKKTAVLEESSRQPYRILSLIKNYYCLDFFFLLYFVGNNQVFQVMHLFKVLFHDILTFLLFCHDMSQLCTKLCTKICYSGIWCRVSRWRGCS